MDTETRIAGELATLRARGDSRDTETYIAGMRRALVLAFGEDYARGVFLAAGEAE